MRFNLILFLMFFSSYIILPQEDTTKIFELGQVTVQASKIERAVKNINTSVTVVSQKETSQNLKSSLLSSLNGRVPGLFITEMGIGGFGIGANAAGKISIRGINGMQQVLVVVDGKPEIAGLFGHPLADNYVTSEVENVDIARGPASVLYGSNAMAGVINISTKKRQREGVSFLTNLSYGSFNTRKLSAGVGYKKEKFSAKISFNNDYSDDHRPSSSYNLINGLFNSSYAFSSIWSLEFDTYITRVKTHNPGTITNPFLDNSAWTDITRANASIIFKNKYENAEGSAHIYFNNGVHDIYDGFHSNDNLFGVTIREGFSISDNTILIIGSELKRFSGKARNAFPLIDTTVTETAGFLVINQKLLNNLNFSGGVRINNHSVYGIEFAPQINLQYNLNKNLSVYTSIAKGFRSPTLNELFLFGANLNLKPERLWNYEAGIKQRLFDNRLRINLNSFLIEGEDFIVMTGMFPNNQNQNIKNISNRGLELETSYYATPQLSFSANYSFLKMGSKIIGAPEHQAFAEVYYQLNKFLFNINLRTISNLYTVASASLEKKQSFTLLNATVWYKVYKNITAFVKTDNLLDRSYEVIDGYPMPGRSFNIGIMLDGVL